MYYLSLVFHGGDAVLFHLACENGRMMHIDYNSMYATCLLIKEHIRNAVGILNWNSPPPVLLPPSWSSFWGVGLLGYIYLCSWLYVNILWLLDNSSPVIALCQTIIWTDILIWNGASVCYVVWTKLEIRVHGAVNEQRLHVGTPPVMSISPHSTALAALARPAVQIILCSCSC